MKPAWKWLTMPLFVSLFIWLLSPEPTYSILATPLLKLREQLVFLTGVVALSYMVLTLVLALRWPLPCRLAGGLDKAYTIHKYAGILTLFFSVIHWLLEKVPHWLVGLGLFLPPGDLGDPGAYTELEIILFTSGLLLVEAAFYGIVILCIIALTSCIPYHIFRLSHKIIPAIFLVIAWHATTAQLKGHWLESPAGYLLILLLLPGVAASLVALFQQTGKSRRHTAVIHSASQHSNNITDLRLHIKDGSLFHQPGQFFFLRFEHDREPHPFTAASCASDPKEMRFAIKKLGDFTDQLEKHIAPGQKVTIEGPYGEFTFQDNCDRQTWVAGGIGVTPFLARLEYLSRNCGTEKPIDFWYCTRGPLDRQFPPGLQELCDKSGVTLHHLNSEQGEHLDVEMISKSADGLDKTSIWFCGPTSFAECLRTGLSLRGFDLKRFHHESFKMR